MIVFVQKVFRDKIIYAPVQKAQHTNASHIRRVEAMGQCQKVLPSEWKDSELVKRMDLYQGYFVGSIDRKYVSRGFEGCLSGGN